MATSLQAKILNKIAQVFEDKGFQDVMVNQNELRITFHSRDSLFSGRVDLWPSMDRISQRLTFYKDLDSLETTFALESTFRGISDFNDYWVRSA